MNIGVLKRLCVHSVTFERFLSTDRYNKPIYSEPLLIDRVRFDNNPVWSKSGNNDSIVANGVLFVYPNISTNAGDLSNTMKSRITFNGTTYVVNKVIEVYEPFSNKVFCYEMEVL